MEKATLEFGATETELQDVEINKDALYLVDFGRLSSVEDLVLLFACLGLSFSPTHPHFDKIKKFLDLENPVIPNNFQPKVPNETQMRLPKLKQVK